MGKEGEKTKGIQRAREGERQKLESERGKDRETEIGERRAGREGQREGKGWKGGWKGGLECQEGVANTAHDSSCNSTVREHIL